jgi:hypothetical protein
MTTSSGWTVILLDDDEAQRIATLRGWDEDDPEAPSHLLLLEGQEAEIRHEFSTLQEAVSFAREAYSCNPPNWPTVETPEGTSGYYDGDAFHWDAPAPD